MGCVYQAQNLINGKCYIGKTVKALPKRISEHYSAAKKGSIYFFHNAIRKYGRESFEWTLLFENDDDDKLSEIEIGCIKLSNTQWPNGYNLTSGGEGMANPSDNTREKIRKANLGNKNALGAKRTDAQKAAVSVAQRGRPKVITEEWKANIIAALKGRECKEVTRQKISISLTGKKQSEAHRLKNSLGHIGRKHSNETKIKMSIAHMGDISRLAAIKGWKTRRLQLIEGDNANA